MLRLDFSASDLSLAENREKTRRASISGVQDKVQLRRVRGGFIVVESGGDYILTPAYDLLNTAVHFPNEPSATGLDFFANDRFTSAYEALGFYSSADFLELGAIFGVPEDEVHEQIEKFSTCTETVRRMVEDSRLSSVAKERYLTKFADRVKAVLQ